MSTTAEELTITRVFDAPRERVWNAWTEPDQIARWWGKRGWRTPVESVTLDVRPGGRFQLNSINEQDGREMPLEAVYHEVVEHEFLAFASSDGGGSEASVTLTDLGDGRTEMVFRTTMHAPDDVRASATAGLASAFGRLAEHLALEKGAPLHDTEPEATRAPGSIVQGVDFTLIPVRDFDAAMEFYGTTLGLPLSVRYERVPGAEFETGNLTLCVMDSAVLGLDHAASKNAIALRVADVAAARAELEARGVKFQGEIVDSGVCKQAYFSDPDGHALILHHRYAPTG